MRIMRATRPLTDAWRRLLVESRGATMLGISFRPLQAAALRLDVHSTLETLLRYPIQVIRLGAYWNQIEPEPGAFITDELDWQIAAAERAGTRIILCLGPLKTFGYPEFFVPPHHLRQPFPERSRVTPSAYPALLDAGCAYIARLVERYGRREAIVAWQLEHEAVDPLGLEHSWRLDADFVAAEFAALRAADPTWPIVMNGYLPTTLPVLLAQWWQTRDQGDSLAAAQRLADIVGIDYYPRQALIQLGGGALYLDGSESPWSERRRRRIGASASERGQRLMITEGQAEPWETVTTPPSPDGSRGMSSCLPENIITNYNTCMRWSRDGFPLYAYLFWGAEYWVLRGLEGDTCYLDAFARILEESQ